MLPPESKTIDCIGFVASRDMEHFDWWRKFYGRDHILGYEGVLNQIHLTSEELVEIKRWFSNLDISEKVKNDPRFKSKLRIFVLG